MRKIISWFILMALVPLPVLAVTFQGGDTVALQGDRQPVLPSADADEFAHDFSDLAGWTVIGEASIVSNALRVTTAATGGDYVRSPTQTKRTEYWVQFEYTVDSTDIGSSQRLFGSGLRDNTSGNIATIGIQGIGSDTHWYARWKTDSGEGSNLGDSASPRLLVGTGYTLVIHWKAATGAGTNDGVFQAWAIDPSLNVQTVLDLHNLDNDTVTAELFQAGSFDGTGTGTQITMDTLKMGTAGQEYVP